MITTNSLFFKSTALSFNVKIVAACQFFLLVATPALHLVLIYFLYRLLNLVLNIFLGAINSKQFIEFPDLAHQKRLQLRCSPITHTKQHLKYTPLY
jgi:hypothetical protein